MWFLQLIGVFEIQVCSKDYFIKKIVAYVIHKQKNPEVSHILKVLKQLNFEEKMPICYIVAYKIRLKNLKSSNRN